MDTKRFEDALHALESGRFGEALSEFDSLANLASNAEEKGTMLLGQASSLMQAGLIIEARERLTRATACWRNLYADHIDLILSGLENRGMEPVTKLTEFLSRRQELNQSGDLNLWSDAAERLGHLLFKSGQYEDAIKPFLGAAETAETEARRAELKLYAGMCYIQVGDFSAADQALLESLPASANDPLWASVQYQRGRLYFRSGAYVQARAVLEELLMADGIDSHLAQHASELLAEVGRRLPNEVRSIV
jgi:tetratricopeptide (TPR) repeat protein